MIIYNKYEIYYAYSHIHLLIEYPYNSIIHGVLINETIFNGSKFLVNSTGNISLPGIIKVYIFICLESIRVKIWSI